MTHVRRLCVVFLLSVAALPAAVEFSVPLPTPKDHYATYNVDQATLALMSKVMNDLDPEMQQKVMDYMAAPEKTAPEGVTPETILATIDKLGLRKYKTELLEVFVHQSQVLDLVPEDQRDTVTPILHDALLAFLDGLGEERLAERLFAMSRLPPEAERGEKILILASKIPTLQKLGQIVARMDGIPPDIRSSLETLENQISTMSRDDLVDYIRDEVGDETLERYRIRFDDKVLAEASVGAVIRGTFVPPSGGEPVDMVCKLIKPYAATGLPRELEIVDGLVKLAAANSDFYDLGGIPLEDLFADIRAKLAEELRVTQEQDNFRQAATYYRGSKLVKIPEVYDFSTENATFMEFLEGEKVTDAFRGDQAKRTELAKRLIEVMTFDAMISPRPVAVFHGDPHAGNVMHITNDPERPYLIGLLDWGLMGELDREQRKQMVQLALAFRWGSQRRLHENVGSLLRGGLPADPSERDRVFALADQCLDKEGKLFEVYASLIENLTRAGFALDPAFGLFIKSQFTLAGIYRELDPDLNPDDYTEKLTRHRVMAELPKRLLLLPAWTYRGYRSLMSNGEVFSEPFR